MIFSKNIYKIASGEKITLFATSENTYDVFAGGKGVQKYNLSTVNPARCIANGTKQGYHNIIKLTNELICVCFDDNISITYEK